MVRSNKHRLLFLPAILYALLIFILSSLPSSAIPDLEIAFDDLLLHFIEYSVFGFFLGMAFITEPENLNWKRILVVCLIGCAYAASDEYHQSFVEGRYSQVSDFLADTVGVIFGMVIYAGFFIRFRRKSLSV